VSCKGEEKTKYLTCQAMKIAELLVLKLSNSEQKNFMGTKTKIMMMIMLMIRYKRRAYKNMATANSVYNTTITVHNEYYSKQLTQNSKTA
jgi:hypothetical protein